jgi:hypothetical protein
MLTCKKSETGKDILIPYAVKLIILNAEKSVFEKILLHRHPNEDIRFVMNAIWKSLLLNLISPLGLKMGMPVNAKNAIVNITENIKKHRWLNLHSHCLNPRYADNVEKRSLLISTISGITNLLPVAKNAFVLMIDREIFNIILVKTLLDHALPMRAIKFALSVSQKNDLQNLTRTHSRKTDILASAENARKNAGRTEHQRRKRLKDKDDISLKKQEETR